MFKILIPPFPSEEQVKDVGWFRRGTSLIKIGLSTMAAYPKIGSISPLFGLGAAGNSDGFAPGYFIIERNQFEGKQRNVRSIASLNIFPNQSSFFAAFSSVGRSCKDFGVGLPSQFEMMPLLFNHATTSRILPLLGTLPNLAAMILQYRNANIRPSLRSNPLWEYWAQGLQTRW